MNRVLHITNHVGTIANLNNVFALLGKPQILSTIKCPLRLHISEEYANILSKHYTEVTVTRAYPDKIESKYNTKQYFFTCKR